MWTGLNNYNGNWGWIDGTPLDYKNWDCLSCLVNGEHEHCQPDGPGNCCNCAHMGFICGDKSSAWDDDPCTTISNFVCKRSSTTN
uniref:C-type lectin domain-containing protein n=1 Tax=Acrobeloides nanus TaxID=290746 RepID=A0A914CYD7_9BILA